METIIKGYNKNNRIVVTKTVDYNNRHDAINEIMDNEKVTHITATIIMKKSV